jgi:Trk K+ transport system NAD-binding subunit
MAKRIIDGIEFEVPEGSYTGEELQQQAGVAKDAVPVIRRKDKDIIVAPQERVNLERNDTVVFTTPMEAA